MGFFLVLKQAGNRSSGLEVVGHVSKRLTSSQCFMTAPFFSSNDTPRRSSLWSTMRPASSAAAGGGSAILYMTSRLAAALVKSRTSSSEEARASECLRGRTA